MEQPTLYSLDHLVITAADMDATIAFYTHVLGMTHRTLDVPGERPRHALFFGAHKINLHQRGAEFEPKAAQANAGTADLCFLTEIPLDIWQAHLTATGTQIELGPVPRTGAQWPMQSLYVRDPDGNLIEIAIRAD
ncbi:VOC family protein [Tateyamaria omphalii]|uniref:VOC family virulence protein n=1 Tax=Tateyamaria omphalii TaxID=299262 RepID=A0A1P8MXI6_9RHOB|nr:VOC family protein [Tateyamaria omphalii]APX12795.1 VOC family virulence protein [Tateyamaria omphalii]